MGLTSPTASSFLECGIYTPKPSPLRFVDSSAPYKFSRTLRYTPQTFSL
jgi:hypothetical protein